MIAMKKALLSATAVPPAVGADLIEKYRVSLVGESKTVAPPNLTADFETPVDLGATVVGTVVAIGPGGESVPVTIKFTMPGPTPKPGGLSVTVREVIEVPDPGPPPAAPPAPPAPASPPAPEAPAGE
jgi:hypothetical protein